MLPTCEMEVVRDRIAELHRQAARPVIPGKIAVQRHRPLRRVIGQRLQEWGERLIEHSMPRTEGRAAAGDCDC